MHEPQVHEEQRRTAPEENSFEARFDASQTASLAQVFSIYAGHRVGMPADAQPAVSMALTLQTSTCDPNTILRLDSTNLIFHVTTVNR